MQQWFPNVQPRKGQVCSGILSQPYIIIPISNSYEWVLDLLYQYMAHIHFPAQTAILYHEKSLKHLQGNTSILPIPQLSDHGNYWSATNCQIMGIIGVWQIKCPDLYTVWKAITRQSSWLHFKPWDLCVAAFMLFYKVSNEFLYLSFDCILWFFYFVLYTKNVPFWIW